MLIAFLLILVIPATSHASWCRYSIRKGDTLYSLSRLSGVPIKKLQYINRIKDPRRLRPGQKILLPCKVVADLEGLCPYKVRRGDTLIGLSIRFGIPVKKIALYNNLSVKKPLIAGRPIYLPCDKLLDWKITQKVKLTASEGLLKKHFKVKGVSLLSPIGRTMTVAVVGNRVDIPLLKGEKVLAVARGKVVYLERSINGMNSFVLLKHPGGLYSVYVADGIAWTIRKGMMLRKGQQMGYAVRNTVLRLWIRTKNRPIKPKRFVEVVR